MKKAKKDLNKPDRMSKSDLHTDYPLSEKDEIKEAEQRLNKINKPSIPIKKGSRNK